MRRADQANERYVTNYRLTVVGNTLGLRNRSCFARHCAPGCTIWFRKAGSVGIHGNVSYIELWSCGVAACRDTGGGLCTVPRATRVCLSDFSFSYFRMDVISISASPPPGSLISYVCPPPYPLSLPRPDRLRHHAR